MILSAAIPSVNLDQTKPLAGKSGNTSPLSHALISVQYRAAKTTIDPMAIHIGNRPKPTISITIVLGVISSGCRQ